MSGVIPPNPHAAGATPSRTHATHSQQGGFVIRQYKKYGPPLGKKASYAAACTTTGTCLLQMIVL
jgi:hypothetical protein